MTGGYDSTGLLPEHISGVSNTTMYVYGVGSILNENLSSIVFQGLTFTPKSEYWTLYAGGRRDHGRPHGIMF
jgi:hypothetical protein